MITVDASAATAIALEAVRIERSKLLADCDWTQLPDAPLPVGLKQEWADYRQALRDITEQADPFSIVWPVAP